MPCTTQTYLTRLVTKQGTPKFVTEAHYILATISLKFRAGITKFQGGVPKALKDGISLVRLAYARTKAQLAAPHRIVLPHKTTLL
jgi:hypothetical protein